MCTHGEPSKNYCMYEQYLMSLLTSIRIFSYSSSAKKMHEPSFSTLLTMTYAAIAKKKPARKGGLKSIFLEEIWRRQTKNSIFMVQRNTFNAVTNDLLTCRFFPTTRVNETSAISAQCARSDSSNSYSTKRAFSQAE